MDEDPLEFPAAPARSPRRLRRHLNPPTVISVVALFVALGGTGYAAAKLPAKSVGTAQLRGGAVTSTKVKNGSLLAQDFKKGQLLAGRTGRVGPAGAPGPQGAPGPAGAAGAPGPRGGFSSVVTRAAEERVGSGRTISVFARCTAAEIAVGGGGTFVGGTPTFGTILNRSAPHHVLRDPATGEPTRDANGFTESTPEGADSADGWTVTGTNITDETRILRAFVLCVPRP